MKKVLIIAAAALFAGSAANAQSVMKQTGGERNFEVMFAPLGGSPISIGGIKYRQFTSATTAIRATVFLGYNTTSEIDAAQSIVVDGETINGMTSTSEFNITVSPGIESHFVGTDRLSPYVGAEANLEFGNTAVKREAPNTESTEFEDFSKTTTGYFGVGATAFAGVDFYFADNIYLGTEIGFGAMFTTEFDEKTSFEDPDSEETSTGPQGSTFGIGPSFVAQIRLGWLF